MTGDVLRRAYLIVAVLVAALAFSVVARSSGWVARQQAAARV